MASRRASRRAVFSNSQCSHSACMWNWWCVFFRHRWVRNKTSVKNRTLLVAQTGILNLNSQHDKTSKKPGAWTNLSLTRLARANERTASTTQAQLLSSAQLKSINTSRWSSLSSPFSPRKLPTYPPTYVMIRYDTIQCSQSVSIVAKGCRRSCQDHTHVVGLD